MELDISHGRNVWSDLNNIDTEQLCGYDTFKELGKDS